MLALRRRCSAVRWLQRVSENSKHLTLRGIDSVSLLQMMWRQIRQITWYRLRTEQGSSRSSMSASLATHACSVATAFSTVSYIVLPFRVLSRTPPLAEFRSKMFSNVWGHACSYKAPVHMHFEFEQLSDDFSFAESCDLNFEMTTPFDNLLHSISSTFSLSCADSHDPKGSVLCTDWKVLDSMENSSSKDLKGLKLFAGSRAGHLQGIGSSESSALQEVPSQKRDVQASCTVLLHLSAIKLLG